MITLMDLRGIFDTISGFGLWRKKIDLNAKHNLRFCMDDPFL